LDCGQHLFTTATPFLAFDQPDVAKLTVGFQLEHLGDNRTRLVTETLTTELWSRNSHPAGI